MYWLRHDGFVVSIVKGLLCLVLDVGPVIQLCIFGKDVDIA